MRKNSRLQRRQRRQRQGRMRCKPTCPSRAVSHDVVVPDAGPAAGRRSVTSTLPLPCLPLSFKLHSALCAVPAAGPVRPFASLDICPWDRAELPEWQEALARACQQWREDAAEALATASGCDLLFLMIACVLALPSLPGHVTAAALPTSALAAG